MSDIEHIRTPREIIDDFAEQAKSIVSGGNARLAIASSHIAEVQNKFLYRNAIDRGRGHSVFSCRDGKQK